MTMHLGPDGSSQNGGPNGDFWGIVLLLAFFLLVLATLFSIAHGFTN